jgi:uncharacterized protein with HEPN domain
VTKDPTVYIRHIYDCIQWIKEYAQIGQEAFFQDKKTQDAIIRNLEVIGQAVKDFGTAELVTNHPEIPWIQIAGTRNILAHQYLGVDNELIWNIVELELPQLEQAIIQLASTYGIDFQ